MKKAPKTKTLKLKVNPEQGMAAFAANISMPGYRMVSLDRRGENATVKFKRIDE